MAMPTGDDLGIDGNIDCALPARNERMKGWMDSYPIEIQRCLCRWIDGGTIPQSKCNNRIIAPACVESVDG